MAGSAHAFSPQAGDLIAPERNGHMPHFRAPFEAEDVIDAEFEAVVDDRPVAKREGVRMRRPGGTPALAAGRGSLFERPSWPGPLSAALRRTAFPAAVMALCASSFLIFGGHAVLARLLSHGGGSAPLVIAGVSTRIGVIGGLRVAIVNGTVRNATAHALAVPAIGVSVGTNTRSALVRAAVPVLQAGETTGFRARLPIGEGTAAQADVAFVSAAAQ